MNYYTWMCIFAVVAVQCVHGNSGPEVVASNPLIVENELNYKTNCSRPGLYCKSCNVLVMCVETEIGWAEQHVADCYDTSSCYVDRCISGHNILCDGTKDIPFKCHVPGIFPDPFDCQSYHMCVVTTENPDVTTPYPTETTTQGTYPTTLPTVPPTQGTYPPTTSTKAPYTTTEPAVTTPQPTIPTTSYPETTTSGNNTIKVLKGFKHTCPSDGFQNYRYDAKSTYCKYKIGSKCTGLPVPVCQYAGQTDALIENDSIYYVCEKINKAIYPNLYACPHGRKYIAKRCVYGSEIETTTMPTTIPPTYPSTYEPSTTGPPTYPTTTTTTTPWTYTTTTPWTYTTTTPWTYTTTTRRPTTTTTEYTTYYPETTTSYPEYTTYYPETTTYYTRK